MKTENIRNTKKEKKYLLEFSNSIEQFLFMGESRNLWVINDLAKFGADGGFPYLTYVYETREFYNKFESDIFTLLYELSRENGFSVPMIIANLKGAEGVVSEDGFKNCLVWWAVGFVAKKIIDKKIDKALIKIN